MLSVQEFSLCHFCLLSLFLCFCVGFADRSQFFQAYNCSGMDSPQASGKYLSAMETSFTHPVTLVFPPPFLTLLCVPSSSYCLLAFPFVRHAFSESPPSCLQGSVVPQGWSMGPAGMGDVQHWVTSGLSPWRLPLQLSPAIGTQCSDLYYLDHFQFLLLFYF